MSELSKRMRNIRDAARLRPLRISSAYDGGMTVAMMRGKIEEPAANIEFDCGHEEAHKGPMSWEFSRERAEFFVAAANEMTALCDEIERLEAENARLKLVAENAPLLDSMGRGVGNPLDRLEDENAALKVENAALRKSIDDLARTVAAEDPGISRSSGGDAESWERRAREYANAFDRVVEKIEVMREDLNRSDPDLSPEIATAPKSHPPEDHAK